MGTRVQVLTPRHEVAGCFIVGQAGQYGFVHVYGAEGGSAPIHGFRFDEPLRFAVNGREGVPSERLLWHDDKTPHQVDLDWEPIPEFLPLILR